MGYALLIVFAALLIIGAPIGVSLGLASIVGLEFFSNAPLEVASQRMISGLRNFSLMAIPLYVLAGTLMNASGITQRLIDFAYSIVGGVRGGLAHTTIVTTAIFGGISGSQVADTSSVGRLMIPQMIARGYKAPYAVSVMATAGAMFVTIPPSINLIVYGVLAQASIADLFFYGLLIGLAFIVVLLLAAYIAAVVSKQPKEKRASFKVIGRAFVRAIWSLLIPVVIIGGIRIGVFTATEGGAVAVFLAIVVGFFIHKELTPKKFVRALVESGILVGVIMLVIACAQMYSWALVTGQIPQAITSFLMNITDNPLMILLLINILILIIGTVMEGNAALIVFVPILLPVATAVGIDPVHLGLIMVVNLGIGLLTPPVGMCLLVSCKIGKITMAQAIPAMLPWFGIALAFLFGVTYLPILFGWF
ncbi:TRAP transporter large permease [Salinibacterium hongtaonis]|uniref:TRAP transporter large permease n=1 Tax=Homoserinimonas hongtaonis TaxID=2079791 RepID=A0A2U1SZD4_9MICO|nr:TRAP transporter large permease [Salinibacterium hongtaonis]AWB89530.1 C4-dicarboxylate ABC transporter permease [Salinibacterium hongtaonis]PWB96972.1 TRAP transporter large permease [Salinibacterium hongtaonis]